MEKIFFSLIFVVSVFLTINNQNLFAQLGPKILFDREIHDYGYITYDGYPYCIFEFENTGNKPLTIYNAKASCGCVIPEWPKDAIQPGSRGSIRIIYDTKRVGVINKSVTITSNAVNVEGGISILRLKGEVRSSQANGILVNNPSISDKPSNKTKVIQMKKMPGGTYEINCKVNGIALKFIFDTGASDVSISLTEALFMLKNGYLKEEDILGTQYYSIANGDIAEGTTIRIKKLEFGGLTLYNVDASIVHQLEAPLLLGQSAISRLGKIQIDPSNSTLTIIE